MAHFPAPQIRTAFSDDKQPHLFSRPWVQWFQAITNKFNAIPPEVTGSRGGNAALASLLTNLDTLGIISDKTTP